ncbi:phage holin family protein [Paenibacillus sp. MAH-36]|uniref:Phage holin family protein n=1 Tax=Paenibacillus violae TaxID=3077234 RepID=A0ABU3R7C4_9BACL|nr:phage holin family protein [Paenibacillus sp. PFR10]MDU0200175.1 phage holin family protein [Paenibacillus sp. PFR10]
MEKSIASTFFVALTAYAFGGWTGLLGFLALASGIDYVTGVLASVKEGQKLSSSVGYWGLMKKALMFTAIMLAHQLDVSQGTTIIMQGAIYSFLVNELISISENYGRLGLPLPKPLQDAITLIKSKISGTAK